MKRNLLSLLFLTILSVSSFSQSSIEDLKEDAVVITNQKMTLTIYRMINSEGESVQYKFYGEAPENGVISRDNFTQLFFEVYQSIINEFGDAEVVSLDEIIGEADAEVKIYMAHTGIQLVEAANGTPASKSTFLWKDVLTPEQITNLNNDLILTSEGKWNLNQFQEVTLKNGAQKQLKFTAETSNDGYISRDYFVAIASEYLAKLSEELQIDDETDVAEIVGDPDIIITIHMSKAGIQIILNNNGSISKETHLWKDYFTN